MSGNRLAATTFAGVAREMLRAALVTVVLGSALYAQAPAATPPAQPPPPTQKVWPDEPLRGFLVFAYNPDVKGGFLAEEDFRKFKAWNINVLRLWIEVDRTSPPTVVAPANDPMAPYKKNMEGLKVALALAEKYHIYIVPVAGGIIGRETDALQREVNPGDCYPGLIAFWEYIAKNFGTNPWLLGYDLLNEPNSKNDVDYWHSTKVPQLIERIRAIDQDTYVVVEPAPWALPDQAFSLTLKPVKDHKVVYCFHFYYPMGFTHQGVYADYPAPAKYPGMLHQFGVSSSPLMLWNKAALEASMKNAIVFQQKYHVKIFVDEFSVIRWAPDGARWVADVVDIFERHHFSWTYHCYGGWNGWNPTFPADAPQSGSINDGGVETDRLKVLMKAWAKNEKF